MAVKRQDVIITGVILCVALGCVCERLADIGVRGPFSICTVAEKWALNPNNYIVSEKKSQHF